MSAFALPPGIQQPLPPQPPPQGPSPRIEPREMGPCREITRSGNGCGGQKAYPGHAGVLALRHHDRRASEDAVFALRELTRRVNAKKLNE